MFSISHNHPINDPRVCDRSTADVTGRAEAKQTSRRDHISEWKRDLNGRGSMTTVHC